MNSIATLATLVTLNLHGYHPTDAPPKYLQDRQGNVEVADSYLFYFKYEELLKGTELRNKKLAIDLQKVSPDFIALQEVGSGEPTSARDCKTFESHSLHQGAQLQRELYRNSKHYQLLSACRGNRGWVTHGRQFSDKRIVTKSNNGTFETVFDFDSNPYPNGILTEGLALLIEESWNVAESGYAWIPYNKHDHETFFQWTFVERDSKVLMLVNIHAGRKVPHFEQAVAIRSESARRYAEFQKRYPDKDLRGQIFAGDFNALLFRGDHKSKIRTSEVSTIPWEIYIPGVFDYRAKSFESWKQGLSDELLTLNRDLKFSPGATITPESDAISRIQHVVELLGTSPGLLPARDTIDFANSTNRCKPTPALPSSCTRPQLIDHIFVSDQISILNSWILYPENNWTRTDSLSDHPGVVAEVGVF